MPLYIVSLRIGDPDDITLRAIKTIENSDFVICEEFKNGRKLLKKLQLEKELFSLNEHNEDTDSEPIIQKLLFGASAALFSDCGTPLFADPGTHLVARCVEMGIDVIPVPGASSLLAALVVCGFPIKQFHYAGFLSRNSEERKKEIRELSKINCAIVIYDTPYRLKSLLEDLRSELQPPRSITVAISLTQQNEQVLRGSIPEVLKQLGEKPSKREFVLIVSPLQSIIKSKKHVKNRKRSGKMHHRKRR